MRSRMESRLASGQAQQMGPGTNGDGELTFETPLFAPGPPRSAQGQFGRREVAWMIFDLSLEYVRDSLLPAILMRHLESGGALGYQVEVVTRTNPPGLIYQSDPGVARI